MHQRTVVQMTGLQLSNLAEPRTVEITKPERGQSIPVELDDNHSTKFDLSAVADENMTFVHAGTKLVIQFDNQSTIVADPFFDSSGKPFRYLDIELSGGRSVTGEQFAQLVSETVGQSVFLDDDRLPSGAHFDDPFVDPLFDGSIGPLPRGSSPLVQFEGGQQGPNLFADVGGLAPSQQILSTPTPTFTGSGAPGINIPAPGGAATQVFEAGLLVARGPGESAGSDAGNRTERRRPSRSPEPSPSPRRGQKQHDGRDPNGKSHLEPRMEAPGNTGKTPNEV